MDKAKEVSERNNLETSKKGGQNSWYYPKTKRQAINYMDEGVRISLTKSLAGNIVSLLHGIGADNEIPDTKKERVSWLNHFHKQIAVNNPLWPEDMSFGFVYASFANALMYDRVELKGHNIHAFISAFKKWITQSGVMDSLRESWLKMNPDKQPKQLKPKFGSEEAVTGTVSNWADSVILDQYNKLLVLYDQEMVDHLSELGAKSYTIKIIEEVKKRNLIDGKMEAELLYD